MLLVFFPFFFLLWSLVLAQNVTILDDKNFQYSSCFAGNISTCSSPEDCPTDSTAVNGSWHDCNSRDGAVAVFSFTGSGITLYGIAPETGLTPNTSLQPVIVEIDGAKTYIGNDISAIAPHTSNVSLADISGLEYGNHRATVRPGIISTPSDIFVGSDPTRSGSTVVWAAGQNPCQGTHITTGPGSFCAIPFSMNGMDGLTLEGCGFALWIDVNGTFFTNCDFFSEPIHVGCTITTQYKCGSNSTSFSSFLLDYVAVDQTLSNSSIQSNSTSPGTPQLSSALKKNSAGIIVGAVIGSLVGLLALAAAAFFLRRRRMLARARLDNSYTPYDSGPQMDELPPAYSATVSPSSANGQDTINAFTPSPGSLHVTGKRRQIGNSFGSPVASDTPTQDESEALTHNHSSGLGALVKPTIGKKVKS